MNYLDELAKKPAEWIITEGPLSHTVISSRIRLARNLAGHRFAQKAKSDELEQVAQKVIDATKNTHTFQKSAVVRLEETSPLERRLLLERHLVSQELAKGGKARAVIIGGNETYGIMVNEEDHIRMQCITPGFAIQDAWASLNKVDDELDNELAYAFLPEWGYLTACPTNVGTGIRASVMLHLPALAITKQIDSVLQKVSQAGLAVRGFYGEGSEASGDLYQISNQITLGQTEEDLVLTIETFVKQIIGREQNCRKQLLKEAKSKAEDVVYRAWGVLTNARLINSRESMKLISHLRLGISYQWIDMSFSKLNELLLMIQPAHLQKSTQKDLDETERDILRANIIRKMLVH